MKVAVHNKSSSTRSIGVEDQSPLRLLVEEKRWDPPHCTDGRVVRTSLYGTQGVPRSIWKKPVYAIPPNDPGCAEPHNGGETFATYWDGTFLGPGDEYYRPGNREGDLVFYAPAKGRLVSVLGIAYLKKEERGWRVIGYRGQSEWGRQANPDDF
jgi:hypothetical protein